MFIYSSVPGFVHLQSSVPGFVQSFKAKESAPSLSNMAPNSELPAPPLATVPFLQTLCLHPHLSPSVRLAWHRLEKSEGWAFCTLGSRLILVSWLYLFSILLPLYSASTSTAWLEILNRPPDLSTAVSNFRASFGKCWKEGGEREGGGQWRSSLPRAVLAVTQVTLPCRSTLDI